MASRRTIRTLFGVALAAAANAAAAEPALWDASYRVTFGVDDRGVPEARVESTLTWADVKKPVPAAVEVGMAEDGLPGGYGSFLRDFTPRAQVLSTPGGRFLVPVPAGGVVQLRYRVMLEHDPTNWGPGPDEAPYRFDGGAFWSGRALFVTADRSSVEVTFSHPAGQRIAASYEPVPGRVGTFRASSESRLRNAFLVVGRFDLAELQVGDARVVLVLGRDLAGSMPVVTGAVRHFLDASEKIFHGAPPSRILVVANLGAPVGSMHGGVFGSDISVLVHEPPTSANASWWRPFLCHEIFHLWNGTAIDFPAGQQYWFTEGVTEYESQLLPVRLREVPANEFLRTMSVKAGRYLDAAGAIGLVRAGDEKFLNNALVYDGGALAAMALDVTIRSRTSNRKSLDDLLHALYDRARARKGRGLALEDVESAAVKLGGSGIREFFRRYVRGDETLPLEAMLRLAGLDLKVEHLELPETDAILGYLLRCPSVTVVGAGLQVNFSVSATIRSGDLITGVNGAPVRTFDELRSAFEHRRGGSRVKLSVVRDGGPAELDVLLPGQYDTPIEHSRMTRVSIAAAADASPAAVAIRKALLGP